MNMPKFKITDFATLSLAIATFIIAYFTWQQSKFTNVIAETYKQELKSSYQPEVILSGSSIPFQEAVTTFDRVGQPTEFWILPYYVINTSDQPAFKILYSHEISNSPKFQIPDDESLETSLKDNILYPNFSWQCGADKKYRQDVLDNIQNDQYIYRHFYVKYQDKIANTYAYLVTWKLKDGYKIGDHPQWAMITYMPVSNNNL